ncbi:MAG: 16S rRNA (uracil(1498)-N(3))-methyltransferase [Bacteroidota bacterium]
MQLFYHPTEPVTGATLSFSAEESKHIVRVLRKKVGDVLQATDGQGHFFTITLTHTEVRNCQGTIGDVNKVSKKPYQLHMAVAPTKMNERFEWFLEKATELGVDEITPILCERSERKVIKAERLERVLVSAMKQSLRAYLPKLNPLTPYQDFLEKNPEAKKFIAHCAQGKRNLLTDFLPPQEDVVFLVGPEGDFSENEIQSALDLEYVPVTLGKNRLRTETAAVMTCASFALFEETS